MVFIHLHCLMVSSIAMYHKQFNFQSFVYTWLNGQTVIFLTIEFNASHLFVHSLNVK